MSDTPTSGHATRSLSQTSVTRGEERGPVADYLRKRHTSEGPRRRRFNAMLPPDLADLEDADLDDRNARVWAVVLADCQRAAGLEPDAYPNTSSVGKPSAHGLALRAALRIAKHKYGIPTARLAELTERTPQTIGRLIDHKRTSEVGVAGVTSITTKWYHLRGPDHVDAAAATRQVDLPAHVYAVLQAEASRSGERIAAVVARLVQAVL